MELLGELAVEANKRDENGCLIESKDVQYFSFTCGRLKLGARLSIRLFSQKREAKEEGGSLRRIVLQNSLKMG